MAKKAKAVKAVKVPKVFRVDTYGGGSSLRHRGSKVFGQAKLAPASAASSRVAELVAQHGRAIKDLEQQINRMTAIPKSSDGRTENLGNAPTPPPDEPTQNEPGSVMFQNPPDPSASVPSKAPKWVGR